MPRTDPFRPKSAPAWSVGCVTVGSAGDAPREWWRWGRIELPVQNRVAGDFLQVFPAYVRFASRVPDRRGAPLAIRRASRLFDAAHRSRRRRTSPDDIFAVRGGGTVSMLTD